MPLWHLSPVWKEVGCSLSKQITLSEDSKKLEKIHFKLQSLSIIWNLLHCTHLTIHFAIINISSQNAGSTNKIKHPPRSTKGLCSDLLRSKSCWELKGFSGKIAHGVSLHSCLFAFATVYPLGQGVKRQDSVSLTLYYVWCCFDVFFFSSSANSLSVMLFLLVYALMHFLPSRML